STSVNAASTAAASVTSQRTPSSPSGAPLPRWVTATLSPSSANARATASPMPRLPPVTSTERLTPAGYRPAPTRPPRVLAAAGDPDARSRVAPDRTHRVSGEVADVRPAGERQ